MFMCSGVSVYQCFMSTMHLFSDLRQRYNILVMVDPHREAGSVLHCAVVWRVVDGAGRRELDGFGFESGEFSVGKDS